MTTFFGVFAIIIGLIALIISALNKTNSNFPSILKSIKKSHSYFLFGIGIFLLLTKSLFFFADRGFNYLLVSPTGKMSAVMEQGIKWRGFAKIDKWQKYIDVKVVSKATESDIDELEGVMSPIPIRFIDQVTALGHVSLRFQLPTDNESFIGLAVKYRTMSNLVNNTIIPTVREQLTNTGYMFAAQNYISGEAQSFRQTFEEQLKGGTYAVNKIEVKDTIFNQIEELKTARTIKEIQTSYIVEKILKNGIPKRIPHELSENNIIVSQVIVDKIDLEATFKQRLEAQRDESAKRQLEQQMIETAKAEQQRIVAQGERDKAEERVNQEKEQVKALIAIETKLKQEETNKKLAAIALETERLNAMKQKVTADAEAYEISKKVTAGITPEVKLQMELDRDVRVAAEIAKITFPETMIMGGSSNGGTPLESLIGAAMAKQLQTTKK
ncbi:SPFH domain-containing protein [Saccharicrinis aurantiacus]|uniref:SPFH domain-containing protein n=1 Tax=Saccharicrinis aurantiacus TaxID=1849719 RepID=UPI0024909D29|nr:SPFH domain-containing protein [Saccharicrinis aurantiacus]